jgi:transketolase
MKERILEISKEQKLSHIGSCLSALPIIEEIYNTKRPEDTFVLSSGHAHLAHLVVREAHGEIDNAAELISHDIHCNTEAGCEVATGSLGLGITVALGMAIADKDKDVYCLISDGECAEGSVWEALRIKTDMRVDNLKVYVNANGWGALGGIDSDILETRLRAFCPDINFVRTNSDFDGTTGVEAHYAQIK